jgi:hypothetical protein
MRRIGLFLCLVLSLVFAERGWGRVVDGPVAHDPLLRSITELLDTKGVDLRNGKGTDHLRPTARPQLCGTASTSARRQDNDR